METPAIYAGRYRHPKAQNSRLQDAGKEWFIYAYAVGEDGKKRLETYFESIKEIWGRANRPFEYKIEQEKNSEVINKILEKHRFTEYMRKEFPKATLNIEPNSI